MLYQALGTQQAFAYALEAYLRAGAGDSVAEALARSLGSPQGLHVARYRGAAVLR